VTDAREQKYVREIAAVCRVLYDSVLDSLEAGRAAARAGRRSQPGGRLGGRQRQLGASHPSKPLGLIWIDAHGDMNTPSTTTSGNVHGMPLAALLGEEPANWPRSAATPSILPQHTSLIGIRNLDEKEKRQIRAPGVHVFTMKDIDRDGIAASPSARSRSAATGTGGIHVSFDSRARWRPASAQLRDELEARGLSFPIHFYLSDEWFTPDGAAAMAVPFYLAHPRLEKLEKAQMLEVEGGEHEWCMRILRHEAATRSTTPTAAAAASGASVRPPSVPYPEFYTPKPYSKSFVLHLDPWYAQSHPGRGLRRDVRRLADADSELAQRYAGWPALKKLEYMDALMRTLRGQAAGHNVEESIRSGACARRCASTTGASGGTTASITRTSTTATCAGCSPTRPSSRATSPRRSSSRASAVRSAAWSRDWTGIYQYTIDKVLEDMIARCRELKLRLAVPEEQARQEFTVLLTVQTMNYLHSGGHRVAL
jgi:hypothetical protein